MAVLHEAKYAALFLSEAREHLAAIDEALLALEQAPPAAPPQAPADAIGASLATVFRGVHTIKGMAGAMGYQAAEQLAHALESYAEPMRRAGDAPPADALQRLFDGTELLRAAIDAVPSGQVDPTPAMQAFLRGLAAAPEAGPAAVTPEAVALAQVAPDAVTPDPGAPRTIRLDARRLDTLLDLVGELVITRVRLLRALEASEHPDRAVVRAAHDAARLVSTLQDEVLQARMLPAAQVFDRFPRLVRDLARELGKEVQFTMAGRDLEIDRSLLDAIGEPIMHLLRNALDHGLEDAATRQAAGKPAAGRLTLRAARERAALVIQVRDDGRGIDRDAVRQRAQEQGLHGDSAAALTDDALLQLVAYPGLSTARAVTALSGRGVGVDVVNTRVRALGGRLELATTAGEGTLFTMRLPLTLVIMRALLVQVGGATYAIPAAHVREVLEFTGASRGTGALTITVRDETVPLVALQQRFEDDPLAPAAASVDGVRHVAIVDVAGRRTALLVDALLAQQDILVKPLETVRGARPWFSGATILGDGSPALIVDVSSVA